MIGGKDQHEDLIDEYDFGNDPYKYDPKDAQIDDISEDSNAFKESSLNFEVHDVSPPKKGVA